MQLGASAVWRRSTPLQHRSVWLLAIIIQCCIWKIDLVPNVFLSCSISPVQLDLAKIYTVQIFSKALQLFGGAKIGFIKGGTQCSHPWWLPIIQYLFTSRSSKCKSSLCVFSINIRCVVVATCKYSPWQLGVLLAFTQKDSAAKKSILVLIFHLDGSAYPNSHRCPDEQFKCLCWVRRGLWHPQVNADTYTWQMEWEHTARLLTFLSSNSLSGVSAASLWTSSPVWRSQPRWTLRTTRTTRLSATLSRSSPFLSSGPSCWFSVSPSLYSYLILSIQIKIFNTYQFDSQT